jgi:hypothetical protein
LKYLIILIALIFHSSAYCLERDSSDDCYQILKINPAMYQVKIECLKTEKIVLKERYSKFWRFYISDAKISKNYSLFNKHIELIDDNYETINTIELGIKNLVQIPNDIHYKNKEIFNEWNINDDNVKNLLKNKYIYIIYYPEIIFNFFQFLLIFIILPTSILILLWIFLKNEE